MITKSQRILQTKIRRHSQSVLMKDMQLAVDRIASAIENGEKILVYGDYDVDGTTAVSLMYLYLSKIVEKNI